MEKENSSLSQYKIISFIKEILCVSVTEEEVVMVLENKKYLKIFEKTVDQGEIKYILTGKRYAYLLYNKSKNNIEGFISDFIIKYSTFPPGIFE